MATGAASFAGQLPDAAWAAIASSLESEDLCRLTVTSHGPRTVIQGCLEERLWSENCQLSDCGFSEESTTFNSNSQAFHYVVKRGNKWPFRLQERVLAIEGQDLVYYSSLEDCHRRANARGRLPLSEASMESMTAPKRVRMALVAKHRRPDIWACVRTLDGKAWKFGCPFQQTLDWLSDSIWSARLDGWSCPSFH
mmetsp:Transcript_52856/g.172004  ORF Transcript_52856/g.172004 Transcript_52856/m.172004 type:complete len:195 (-) Transcript_52856:192-776(-)